MRMITIQVRTQGSFEVEEFSNRGIWGHFQAQAPTESRAKAGGGGGGGGGGGS